MFSAFDFPFHLVFLFWFSNVKSYRCVWWSHADKQKSFFIFFFSFVFPSLRGTMEKFSKLWRDCDLGKQWKCIVSLIWKHMFFGCLDLGVWINKMKKRTKTSIEIEQYYRIRHPDSKLFAIDSWIHFKCFTDD